MLRVRCGGSGRDAHAGADWSPLSIFFAISQSQKSIITLFISSEDNTASGLGGIWLFLAIASRICSTASMLAERMLTSSAEPEGIYDRDSSSSVKLLGYDRTLNCCKI